MPEIEIEKNSLIITKISPKVIKEIKKVLNQKKIFVSTFEIGFAVTSVDGEIVNTIESAKELQNKDLYR